jgi:hypothetical protein
MSTVLKSNFFNYGTDFPHSWSTYSMQFIKLSFRDTLYITCFRSVARRVLVESEDLLFNVIYTDTFMFQSFKTET